MPLWEHNPECGRSPLQPYKGDPHDAYCPDCGRYFCSYCYRSVHFPALCWERQNWQLRTNLGNQHFEAYNACLEAWNRCETKDLAVDAKVASFRTPGPDGGYDEPDIVTAVFVELGKLVELLKWSWVSYWHQPQQLVLRDLLGALEQAYDALSTIAPSKSGSDFSYAYLLWESPRKDASKAAISVLTVLATLRQFAGPSLMDQIEFWKTRP